MKNAYTITKNGVVRSSTRAYSKRELERFAAQEEHQKAITHDFYKPDPFYRRCPHELPTVTGFYIEQQDGREISRSTYGPSVKPQRTPYGRVLDSKKARRGYKKPKDLYLDPQTVRFYEIDKDNELIEMEHLQPIGTWHHVFKPAVGEFNCRFKTWARNKGYQQATLIISDGYCHLVINEDGTEIKPYETETDPFGYLWTTGILSPKTSILNGMISYQM